MRVPSASFALMAVLGQGIPVNTGSLEAFHIQIPAGSILDAEPREGADASPSGLFFCLIFYSIACPALASKSSPQLIALLAYQPCAGMQKTEKQIRTAR